LHPFTFNTEWLITQKQDSSKKITKNIIKSIKTMSVIKYTAASVPQSEVDHRTRYQFLCPRRQIHATNHRINQQ